MTDSVHVQGLKQLNDALEGLTTKIQNNIMRGAMRAGAKVMRDHAKTICPVEDASAESWSKYKLSLGWKPGELMRSIRLSAKLSGDQVVGFVKAGNKKAYYAHMVEGGTVAHWIRPKDGKSLFFAGVYSKAIYHPGSRKNPFMRITMDSQSQNALQGVGNYIRKRLTKDGIEIPDSPTEGL